MHLVCACIDDHIFMAFIQCTLFICLLHFSVNPLIQLFDRIFIIYRYGVCEWYIHCHVKFIMAVFELMRMHS